MPLIESVTLEHDNINIPTLINQTNDVCISEKIVLHKPKWVEDTNASSCDKCKAKFTQLKRRHHCRQCGKIYCNACCKDKLFLPHLEYAAPERICDDCKPIVNIFYLAFSVERQLQLEGAKAFRTMCETKNGVKELLLIGGVHILLHMGKIKDDQIRITSLQRWITYMESTFGNTPKKHFNVSYRILTESSDQEIQLEGLMVINVLCENNDFKLVAIDHGALPPLLHLCSSHVDRVALEAVMCLSSITKNIATHNALVYSNVGNALACLLSLVRTTYEPVQEKSIEILANISFGNDTNREKIMQEDVFNGSCLSEVVNTRPLKYSAVCYATCIMANVAATCNVLGGQREYLGAFCNLVPEMQQYNEDRVRLYRHVSRGIANCLKVPNNCDIVVEYIPQILGTFLQCTDSCTRFHGFRIAVTLLKLVPDRTVDAIHRTGSWEFLSCLCATQDTLDTILNSTLSHVSIIEKPD